MSKTVLSPAAALKISIAEYQLTPFALSKAISVSNSAVLQILKGKAKITLPTALRLSKFFGQPPAYWLDLQRNDDLKEAASDKHLEGILKGISQAKKPVVLSTGLPTAKAAAKGIMRPSGKTSLADKRKTAAKTPGARPAKRKPKI